MRQLGVGFPNGTSNGRFGKNLANNLPFDTLSTANLLTALRGQDDQTVEAFRATGCSPDEARFNLAFAPTLRGDAEVVRLTCQAIQAEARRDVALERLADRGRSRDGTLQRF